MVTGWSARVVDDSLGEKKATQFWLLHVGFKADTLAAMKKLTNRSLSAVCVMSILAALSAANFARAATDLPAGSAKGSLTYDGATAELKFAAALLDQKDERKPIVLVISDQKLPVEKWESEFDMMMDHSKWSGVVFFLDKEGKVFRSDVHVNSRQSSVSGIFELKIDNPSSKDLTGIAKTSADEKKQNSPPRFTLRSNRFSLREFAAENIKCPAREWSRRGASDIDGFSLGELRLRLRKLREQTALVTALLFEFSTNYLTRLLAFGYWLETDYRVFFAQAPTRSSAFSMFSIELATLKRK